MNARLLALLLLAACDTPALVQVTGELSADPRSLDFGRVPTGTPRTASFTLSNGSKSPKRVKLSAAEPFSLSATELDLDGAGEQKVDVTFLSTEPGEKTGAVQLTADGQTLTVTLRAEAATLPQCDAPAPACREVHADPETFTCVESATEDGTACSTACVPTGTCSRGDCIGAAPSCDDGNACTLDSCSLESGCTHSESLCLAPDDPCKAALCDPRTGCGIVDVADGAACGPADCTSARVCLGGRCQTRQTPNGAPCGTATPCQPFGVCQNQTCVQPAATVIPAAWTYVPSAGSTITFPGVADLAGNLYWLERTSNDGFVVSVERNGQPRFRQSIGELPGPARGSPMAVIADDTLIIWWETFKNGPGRVEARSTADGTLRWSHTDADLRELLGVSGGNLLVGGIAEGANGDVVANVRSNSGVAAWTSWVAAFARHTGQLRWSRPYGFLTDLIADEAGNVYAYEQTFDHRVFSIDSAGTERWNLLVGNQIFGGAPPIMVVGQSLVTAFPASVRSASTGSLVSQSNTTYFSPHEGPEPVMSIAQMVVPDVSTTCSAGMSGYAMGSWSERWFWLSTPRCIESVVLTRRNSTFFSTRSAGLKAVHEFDAAGVPLYSCEVAAGGLSPASAVSVLHSGFWFTFDDVAGTVQAFDVKGAAPATAGWVSGQGSSARNSRPR